MPEPLEYHRLHRLGRPGVWRAIVGVPLLLFATFVLAPIGLFFPMVVWLLATGQPIGTGMESVLDLDNVTPLGLAYVNPVLAAAIPIAIPGQPGPPRLGARVADVGGPPDPLALPARLHRALRGGTDGDRDRLHVRAARGRHLS
ncbi:hypothetical protein [Nocardioides sp. B-3]|uniref:hypothetical protein n=1 Tax=Nocardioides sp. B-3 TaxID=2895565 RepID=UPI0021529B36|nr:hypothetical protein [Nocardioides sp. B-3]UUZ59935.1 hypothetical protein LP418_02530 [Nocardioides sp. B-3]